MKTLKGQSEKFEGAEGNLGTEKNLGGEKENYELMNQDGVCRAAPGFALVCQIY